MTEKKTTLRIEYLMSALVNTQGNERRQSKSSWRRRSPKVTKALRLTACNECSCQFFSIQRQMVEQWCLTLYPQEKEVHWCDP